MNEYISKQIAVVKNDRALIEFRDKLKVASLSNYAHIHADGEETDSEIKRTSLIGILMTDYSKGTGKNAQTVQANISPDEDRFLFSRLKAGFPSVNFRQEKIFGTPDAKGYSQVTMLQIVRAETDRKGNERKLPWYVEIVNGQGIAVKNAKGGTYMKANSFKEADSIKVFKNLSDLEMYKLLGRTDAYIDAWEKAIAPSLITQAKKALQAAQETQHTTTEVPSGAA